MNKIQAGQLIKINWLGKENQGVWRITAVNSKHYKSSLISHDELRPLVEISPEQVEHPELAYPILTRFDLTALPQSSLIPGSSEISLSDKMCCLKNLVAHLEPIASHHVQQGYRFEDSVNRSLFGNDAPLFCLECGRATARATARALDMAYLLLGVNGHYETAAALRSSERHLMRFVSSCESDTTDSELWLHSEDRDSLHTCNRCAALLKARLQQNDLNWERYFSLVENNMRLDSIDATILFYLLNSLCQLEMTTQKIEQVFATFSNLLFDFDLNLNQGFLLWSYNIKGL